MGMSLSCFSRLIIVVCGVAEDKLFGDGFVQYHVESGVNPLGDRVRQPFATEFSAERP